MSDSDFLKGACGSCQGHVEFPAYAVGMTTTCPHCGIETKLTAPDAPAPATAPPPPPPPPPKPAAPPPPALVLEPPAVATAITPVDGPSTGAKLKKVLKVVWSLLVALAVVGFIGFKLWNKFRRVANTVETVKGEPKPEPAKPATSSPTPAPAAKPAAPPSSVVVAKGAPPARKPGEDLQVLSFEVQKATDGNLQYLVGVVTNHSAKQFFNVKLEFELTRKDGKPGDLATDSLRNLPANASAPFKTSIIGTAPVTSAKLAKLEGEKE
ncbi:MAG: hypothetical protein RL514_504 [Verrucomicrobiota bacterium]|jgi:hypothetical protein